MKSRRRTALNQRRKNAVYVNVVIFNTEQRQIDVVYFDVDLNKTTFSKQRCHFQHQLLQSWAISKQGCEYDPMLKKNNKKLTLW